MECGGKISNMRDTRRSTDFGWLATEYAQTRGGRRRIQQTVTLLTEHLDTSGIVLDIGTGPGEIAASLACESRKLIALDLSDLMTKVASKIIFGSVIRADAQILPLANGSVDAVLMIWVVNHVANPTAAVRDVYRVLRPGGRLLYLSGIPTHPDWDILGKMIERLDSLRQTAVRLERNFRGLAESIGFKVLHEQSHVICFRQRPYGLAKRIEARSYGHLRYLDARTWQRNVAPTIDALKRMPNPDEYCERQNEHTFIVFEKGQEAVK
jgi:ubiquinone/menaquinone biosynthesis C-methylase UbiE